MKYVGFLVLISFSLMASSLERVTSHLPQEIRKLSLRKTSPKDAEKILGKANHIVGKKYYWERSGLKYALELTFDDQQKLSTLHYTFTGKRPHIEVDTQKLVPAGKYFRVKENNYELMVDPLAKTLYSVKFQ